MHPSSPGRESLSDALQVRDLTDSTGGFHALQLLVEDAEIAVRNACRCRALVHRAPRIVSVADHFDRLRYPIDHPERSPLCARYVDAQQSLLRAHAAAGVPSLLRQLSASPPADAVLLLPGIVYDGGGERHELDLWRLREHRPFSIEHVESLIECVVPTLLPGPRRRMTISEEPYTTHAVLVEVFDATAWVEIARCGLAHPDVLDVAGLPASRFSAIAMRLELDRMLMLRKGIGDRRLLRSEDPKVAVQMRDLAPYHSAVDKLSAMMGSSCSSRWRLPSNSM